MPTGVVDIGSDLERKSWMREGLIQASSKSFWTPFTGTSKDSIVYQENDISASAGHTVVFDFDGNLSGKAVKGKETAFGKGEQKRKFSDKVTVERYRLVVDNGDKFDGVNIGDLSINEHSDSRNKLSDLFVRFKDQSIFDAAQGLITTQSVNDAIQTPSHVIDLGSTLDFNTVIDIESILRTSQGFTTGSIRRPLEPFMMNGDQPIWLFVLDAKMSSILRKDTAGYQTVVRSGDFRGNDNRNIKGVIGKLGSILFVEASQFFGSTTGTTSGWGLNDSEIEISGLRQYDGTNPATALWTGQEGFDYGSTDLHSRGLILGKGGIQTAFGMQPDYKIKSSQDFDIKSESALEVWMESRKTKLKLESGANYAQAKVADIDHGVITVDLKVS